MVSTIRYFHHIAFFPLESNKMYWTGFYSNKELKDKKFQSISWVKITNQSLGWNVTDVCVCVRFDYIWITNTVYRSRERIEPNISSQPGGIAWSLIYVGFRQHCITNSCMQWIQFVSKQTDACLLHRPAVIARNSYM